MLHKMFKRAKRLFFPNLNPRIRLLKILPKNAICAEIGAWKGDFSEKIIAITNPNKLYLVDPYMYVPEYDHAWYGGMSGSQEKMDEIYSSIKSRFMNEIQQGQLEIKRSESEQALNEFHDCSLDWIYIDGNHLYEYVMLDLQISWNKVKIGGYIAGDDYSVVGWWEDGVTKAVHEFIEINKNLVGDVIFMGNQFAFRKIK